ncbi:DUF1266 domain-containing protein [Streptomyces sp. NPDC056580]|uniref:DUF1266 domain-containing protein n=1 Tax=Streptomyces sp. NPDC056580 TaxID=3345872 RepID=UPI0036A2DA02
MATLTSPTGDRRPPGSFARTPAPRSWSVRTASRSPSSPSPRPRLGIEGVQLLIGRTTRCEARLRADGVLGDGRYVSSVGAWDLGRASMMAQWGLGARFGTLAEAKAAVVQAGRAASLSYKSWQDFSATYNPRAVRPLR